MKKTLILNLLIVAAIICAGIWAAHSVWGQKGQVIFRQNILTGDAAAADGLTIRILVSESGRSYWGKVQPTEGTTAAEADYDYILVEEENPPRKLHLFDNESKLELPSNYERNPSADVVHLGFIEAQNMLHLHTIENDQYFITFIDAVTGKELQKLLLEKQEPADVISGDNWILLQNGSYNYRLISRQNSDNYEEVIHLQLNQSQLPWNEEDAFVITATSDGNRIALSSTAFPYSDWSADFFIAIYNTDGLEYYAEYEGTLISQDSRDYIRTDRLDLKWN